MSSRLSVEAMDALIQAIPKFRLKVVPADCSECSMEDFHVGNKVSLFWFDETDIRLVKYEF